MHHPIHNSLKDNHNKAELINVDLEIYNLIKDRFVKIKRVFFIVQHLDLLTQKIIIGWML